ncbi:Uncharacterized conserved protein YbcV, DUF1398 family [Pseudarcicella hirudinis]|uniref:Uncharacterized conserved protein YbcV, DUF1398 family n=1 Tax=Pseudarcicella hirudinis TaxID=1079859 RepID=A0A1I5NNQ0_9BACT|nr:DUF1398 family protein [Pseudarcicella hirudinis]SFP23433.1 Uncharacterized conserved protein YbcV, DUF1398 family [Pseudarcicella hirudinis]
MTREESINEAYKSAVNYPDLAQKLINAGIESYSVDVATGIIIYRFAEGGRILHANTKVLREISDEFSEMKTIQAIRDNQEGKSDYPGFMNDIAVAGVRFYEAVLSGSNKRCIYVGNGGKYEENIPI